MNTTDNVLFESFAKGIKANKVKGKNCVIYTRVSTKEQADNNLSLETQKKACMQYAAKCGYTTMGSFGGTYESAKTDERKHFNNMLSFLKKGNGKEKISYIIVYSVDRFSRTGGNAIYIAEQLRKQGIIVCSVTQPTDASTASGSLQQNIQFIFSEYDNQLRREKCMAGVKEMLMAGEWPAAVPFGYDIIKINEKREIVVNDQGRILKKAFYWKLNEKITHKEISERLVAYGLKMNIQRISDHFRNPFYCGLMAHSALEGQIIEGNHEKLISKEIFIKLNDLIKDKFGFKLNPQSEPIPLKRFLKCDICGELLRGYMSKKIQKYYYKCATIGCNCNKRADDIHKQFLNEVSRYTLDVNEDYNKVLQREMLLIYNELNKQSEEDSQQIEKQLSEANKKLDRIEERYVLEEIDRAMYEKFHFKFKAEKAEIEKQLVTTTTKVSNLDKCTEKAITLSSKLATVWHFGDFKDKQNLQNLLFPDGIAYNRKNDECRTIRVNEIFGYVADQTRDLEEGRRTDTPSFSNYSAWVTLSLVEGRHVKSTQHKTLMSP